MLERREEARARREQAAVYRLQSTGNDWNLAELEPLVFS